MTSQGQTACGFLRTLPAHCSPRTTKLIPRRPQPGPPRPGRARPVGSFAVGPLCAVRMHVSRTETTAVVVGALFVLQLLTFAVGSNLVEEYLRGEASRQTLTIGVMLEMCSGIAVVGIGLLMYRVLKEVDGGGRSGTRSRAWSSSASPRLSPLTC